MSNLCWFTLLTLIDRVEIYHGYTGLRPSGVLSRLKAPFFVLSALAFAFEFVYRSFSVYDSNIAVVEIIGNTHLSFQH